MRQYHTLTLNTGVYGTLTLCHSILGQVLYFGFDWAELRFELV